MDRPPRLEALFLDRLYAVAMEPDRFVELIDVWHERIDQALAQGYDADERDLLHLTSHLKRAETLLDIVTTREDLLPRALEKIIQSSAHPILAIDPQRMVRAQNNAAQKFFGTVIDQPFVQLPFDREACAAIFAFAEFDNAADSSATLLQAHDKAKNRLVLISLSRFRSDNGSGVALVKAINFVWPKMLTPLVCKAFALTAAEAEVMSLLAEGNVAAEIARQRQASIATVRTQIRSIYEKTGTRNQNEFMRMAIGLGSLDLIDRQFKSGHVSAPVTAAQRAYPRAEDCFLLTLPDGRILDYAMFGPADGRPCLYLHNEFFGNVWPVAAVDRATQLGLRIIAPARPCYGCSTCPDDRVIDPATIAADLVTLLDTLGVDRAALIFQVAGGISALALAEAYPERVAGLVVVAPMFPSALSESPRKMPFFHRFLANLAENHPNMLEFVCRAGKAFHDRVGTRNFLRKTAHDHPIDINLLDDPAIFADIDAGVRFCATNGHRGFFSDYRNLPRNALDRFLALNTPIIAITGSASKTGSQPIITELVERHPKAEMLIAQGGGHYLHFSHPGMMSDALRKLWDKEEARELDHYP